jgi:hypothetical protein
LRRRGLNFYGADAGPCSGARLRSAPSTVGEDRMTMSSSGAISPELHMLRIELQTLAEKVAVIEDRVRGSDTPVEAQTPATVKRWWQRA